jgi:hypothetical protein
MGEDASENETTVQRLFDLKGPVAKAFAYVASQESFHD